MIEQNEDMKCIPEPFKFNRLKHHLLYIRSFIADSLIRNITKEELLSSLKHTGNSVMDVYSGSLPVSGILTEITTLLKTGDIYTHEKFRDWTGTDPSAFRLLKLSDDSIWTIRYSPDARRYIHIFPSRGSAKTFRYKANTMKTAILYLILNGKDYISETDLNAARSHALLSPVKNISETRSIAELIEMLRK